MALRLRPVTPPRACQEGLDWPAFREVLPPPGHRTLDVGCSEGRVGRAIELVADYREVGHGQDGSREDTQYMGRGAEI
jgi:hypothetical protein